MASKVKRPILPIQNFDSSKEVAVVRMLSNSIQYKMTNPLGLKLVDGSEKQILNRSYTKREIDVIVGRKHILTDLSNDSRIIKTNKLSKVTDMIINLDELNNSDNLEDGHPSNTLFTRYVIGSEDFTHFKPATPQYNKLKGGQIVSLTLRMMDQAGNVIADGLGTTVVLICDCKL